MVVLSTVAFEKGVILEEIDFNKIAKKALDILSFYKSPNSWILKQGKYFKQKIVQIITNLIM